MMEPASRQGRIAVLGAGTMGAQIAQQAALHGYDVVLHDLSGDQLERALRSNRGHLDRRVAKGEFGRAEADDALARVRPEPDLGTAVRAAAMVVEAVAEQLPTKQALFREVERHAPSDAIVASNSSTMTISEIAGDLATRERALALHFFNPALVMRLVEIAPAPFTDPACVETARQFCLAIDRDPVVLRKEIAGLLVNRVLWALRREAMWLADNGYAEPQEIDRAVTLGLNHPMGPFRLADFNGLDVVLAAQRHRFETSGQEADRPSALLERLVADGDLGRKSGRGFYDHQAPEGRAGNGDETR
ncbi:MAG: 3-hydroxyacyl-CoA dehydrogenase family protein [Thermomicrobiales bacterium]